MEEVFLLWAVTACKGRKKRAGLQKFVERPNLDPFYLLDPSSPYFLQQEPVKSSEGVKDFASKFFD